MGRALIYFAIDDNANVIYLSSKQMYGSHFDSTFINDRCDLENELLWEKIEIPKNVGCYQTVIEYEFSAVENILFKVISCTPLIILT
jgi:hypothetical protein